MNEASKPHIDPLLSLRAWLDLDDNGRVMTLVEDPSFTEYVCVLMEQLAKLESLERQAWWKADYENRRAQAAQSEAERAERYAEERDLVAQRLEEQLESLQKWNRTNESLLSQSVVEKNDLREQLETLREALEWCNTHRDSERFHSVAESALNRVSTPATSRRIQVEITGDGSGVALPPIVEGLSPPRTWNPSGGAGASPASSSDAAGAEESSPASERPEEPR